MITRTATGLRIDFRTASPEDDYLNIVGDIIGALQADKDDTCNDRYFLLQLLKEMMPEYDQAKLMFLEFSED